MMIKVKKPSHRFFAVTILSLAMIFCGQNAAFAVCDPPGQAALGGTTTSGTVTGAMNVAEQGLKAMVMGSVMATHVDVQSDLGNMNADVLNRMSTMWKDWDEAWRAMAAQLGAGVSDQTRQLSSIAEATNDQNAAGVLQDREYEAKRNSQPSVEGCGFDTSARYSNSARLRSKGLSSALANNLKKMGTNNKGTPASKGASSAQQSRWQEYQQVFCDPNTNGGSAGCKTPGALANADVMPGKTIYGYDTIPLEDANVRKAVNALTYNVIGYKVPDPIQSSELKVSAGKEKRNTSREYLTQMDAVSALVTSQIGERSPGEAAPEIKSRRMANGVHACASGSLASGSCASDKPSEWEIRQAMIEDVRNPNYYVNLADSGDSTVQKEVLLQAFNTMQLYKLLEKSELIANAYAVQTSNMLERTDRSRASGSKNAPVAPGPVSSQASGK